MYAPIVRACANGLLDIHQGRVAELGAHWESARMKPHDFPEDMSESSTLDELVSEGDNMYDALKEALELIHDLAVELEYKDAVEG